MRRTVPGCRTRDERGLCVNWRGRAAGRGCARVCAALEIELLTPKGAERISEECGLEILSGDVFRAPNQSGATQPPAPGVAAAACRVRPRHEDAKVIGKEAIGREGQVPARDIR